MNGSRTFSVDGPVDLRLTLGPLRRGAVDLSMRIEAGGVVWRATRTPEGLASTRIEARHGRVTVEAWGPGWRWALDASPALVGADDDERGFAPGHPLLQQLRRRFQGLRVTRSGAVVEALVPTVIEQKVQGVLARRSYARLVRRYGEPAPGPGGLVAPPSPAVLASLPYHAFHPLGVERRRADTVRRVATVARRLEEAAAMPPPDAQRRLRAVPGVGPWTAAEVALVALGDGDAVSVGDYHLPHQVAFALAGEPRATDERMLELLEPYCGHRGRVIRLIVAGGPRPPRYGPRLPYMNLAGR